MSGEDLEVRPLAGEEAVANWMIAKGIATGHGDTLDDLLRGLVAHCAERALSVTAAHYGEQTPDWQTGFDRGGTAAALAVSRIINPEPPRSCAVFPPHPIIEAP